MWNSSNVLVVLWLWTKHIFTTFSQSPRYNRKSENTSYPTPKSSSQTHQLASYGLFFGMWWGVILAEYLKKGATVNSMHYAAQQKHFWEVIKAKRPGMLNKRVLLYQDIFKPRRVDSLFSTLVKLSLSTHLTKYGQPRQTLRSVLEVTSEIEVKH